MQAFGPYKYKEVIDFLELENHLLFVVSGNTGAGKTTIFDGIAFALYGHASGEDRKEHKSMRSDFAEDDTYTVVELVFETRGKKYRVLRQLSHVKKGRKTASGENFEFMEILEDGQETPACEKQKSKEISQKIEEIIGLTYDQFHQIVMLPQGEFRKLLTSSTENKEIILRKIFKTERYSQIANQLEQKKKTAEKKRDEAKTLRDMYIDQITGALPARDSQLFERLQGEVNIYQIVESLQAEKAYYVQKQMEDEQLYENAQQQYTKSQQQLATIEQRNERLLRLQQQQQELLQKEQLKPQYEAMQQEAERGNVALQIAAIFEAAEIVTAELQQVQQNYTNLHQQFELAQRNLVASTERLQQEQQTEPERKQLEQSIHELQKVEPLFNEVVKLQQQINQATVQYEKAVQQTAKCKADITSKTEQVVKLTQKEEQLQQQLNEMPQKLLLQQTLEQKLTLLKQYEQASQKVLQHNNDVEEKQEQLNLHETMYHELEQSWVNNQALQLAAHLIDGEPCPVCGSKQHDKQHTIIAGENVSKEVLQQKKSAYEFANRAFFAAEATLVASTQQLQQMSQQLTDQQVDVQQKTSYEFELQQVKSEIQQLQYEQSLLQQTADQRKQVTAELQRLQQLQQQYATEEQQSQLVIETKKVELHAMQQQIPTQYANLMELQNDISHKKGRFEQLQKAFNNAQQVYEAARTEVTKLQEAVNQTEQQLQHLTNKQQQQKLQWDEALQQSPFATISEFKEAIRSRNQIEKLQQDVSQYKQQLFALQQYIEQESAQLRDVTFVDVTEMQQQLQVFKQQAEQAYGSLSTTKNCIQICEQYEQNLNKVASEIVQLEEAANNILNLYNVLRGQNTRKISFERYVQIGYLEQITAAANVRLAVLSNGQYKLVSSERQLSHGRQSGLSLDVHDSYTDQVRDVKTLSGGEKFNASLCLALGMADVIQSYEGNVRIDTMFIDEGFGSLDEESLTRAIDTLIDLQKSGRMIGVISHVAELKAAIPAVLEVFKLKEGYSKTKISVS